MRSATPGGPYTVVSANGNDNTGAVGNTYSYVVRARNGGTFATAIGGGAQV